VFGTLRVGEALVKLLDISGGYLAAIVSITKAINMLCSAPANIPLFTSLKERLSDIKSIAESLDDTPQVKDASKHLHHYSRS
jgi:hypothetical protein